MAAFLTNDGQQYFLEVALRGRTPAATLQIGLTNAALTKTNVLADAVASEPVGNGYARVTVPQNGTGWPTEGLDAGDYMLTSMSIPFTAAGGDITPFSRAFLTDGTLLLAVWDTAQTSITSGNTWDFVAKVKDV